MTSFSIIKKSELGGTRLDAEYYQPEFLKNSKRIINFGSETLQSLSTISITKGETPLWRGDDYLKKGIDGLPGATKEFMRHHDEFVGCKTVGISIGAKSGETIYV